MRELFIILKPHQPRSKNYTKQNWKKNLRKVNFRESFFYWFCECFMFTFFSSINLNAWWPTRPLRSQAGSRFSNYKSQLQRGKHTCFKCTFYWFRRIFTTYLTSCNLILESENKTNSECLQRNDKILKGLIIFLFIVLYILINYNIFNYYGGYGIWADESLWRIISLLET